MESGPGPGLSQVQDRIAQNRRLIAAVTHDLEGKRAVLADRLRSIYATREPTLAEVLVTSGSVTDAVDAVELLDAVAQQDADIVEQLREARERLRRLRAELVADREATKREVATAQREREKVQALLSRR